MMTCILPSDIRGAAADARGIGSGFRIQHIAYSAFKRAAFTTRGHRFASFSTGLRRCVSLMNVALLIWRIHVENAALKMMSAHR
jgi:hypothetical protein